MSDMSCNESIVWGFCGLQRVFNFLKSFPSTELQIAQTKKSLDSHGWAGSGTYESQTSQREKETHEEDTSQKQNQMKMKQKQKQNEEEEVYHYHHWC